jgi:hypothetical protein
MAKQKGSLLACLGATAHYADESQLTKFGRHMVDAQGVTFRFRLVRSNCKSASKQLRKIRKAAKAAGHDDIIKLLDEEAVEIGPAEKT